MIKQPEVEKLKTLAYVLHPSQSAIIKWAIDQLKWRDMDSAPDEYTFVTLEVEAEIGKHMQEGQPTEIVDGYFNGTEWLGMGWCWYQDKIVERAVNPIRWRPRPEPPRQSND